MLKIYSMGSQSTGIISYDTSSSCIGFNNIYVYMYMYMYIYYMLYFIFLSTCRVNETGNTFTMAKTTIG